jgi:proline dehydrogenase
VTLLRTLILTAAGDERVRDMVAGAPISRDVVRRFVAGEHTEDAVRAAVTLAGRGLHATLDHLGEDVTDASDAEATVTAYERLLSRLAEEGVADRAEVSIKLSALGALLPDPDLMVRNAARVCAAAQSAATTLTIDMEDHTTTASTLATVALLRQRWPWVGAVLQSALRRTEADCAALAAPGSRVRLCKGAYAHPVELSHTGAHQVDLAYVRCARTLLAGAGLPMFATHDPRLVRILEHLLDTSGAAAGSVEFQMLYGIRPDEQLRLARAGHVVRVYVPYGQAWYGYLVRRLAERPANTAFFLRSLATRS